MLSYQMLPDQSISKMSIKSTAGFLGITNLVQLPAYSHLVSYFQANLDNIKCYIYNYDNHMDFWTFLDDFEAYSKEEIQNFVIPWVIPEAFLRHFWWQRNEPRPHNSYVFGYLKLGIRSKIWFYTTLSKNRPFSTLELAERKIWSSATEYFWQ